MSIDKHCFHNNIVSNQTWIFGNFRLKNTLYGGNDISEIDITSRILIIYNNLE